MLSYMLPTEEKPPAGEPLYRPLTTSVSAAASLNGHHHQQNRHSSNNNRGTRYSAEYPAPTAAASCFTEPTSNGRTSVTRTTSFGAIMMFGKRSDTDHHHHQHHHRQPPRPGSAAPLLPANTIAYSDSPTKHNGVATTASSSSREPPVPVMRKPNLHNPSTTTNSASANAAAAAAAASAADKVAKDESLHSIESDASTAGSGERKSKTFNGPAKHANLKRVSFGSSKGSMVETLVYETPVQEEPESINHYSDHNGRLPAPMIPVPDTDEGREKVRVSLLGPKPFPSTPGVLLLDPIPVDIMAASHAELLTAHTDHTVPTYHTQISTDSGWDNPFRPDGDLSREADEIVELIKGGKPITPTPGQNEPALPGYQRKSASELDGAPNSRTNGNAHSTPIKPSAGNEKGTATVEVSRVTAQGPGDASQVEHVTLKKKPKCKCCVLQ